jgi:hypothetical protein
MLAHELEPRRAAFQLGLFTGSDAVDQVRRNPVVTASFYRVAVSSR